MKGANFVAASFGCIDFVSGCLYFGYWWYAVLQSRPDSIFWANHFAMCQWMHWEIYEETKVCCW